MKAIAGATGVLGSKISRDLLSRGEKLRVLVRSEEARAAWEALGAEVVEGDLSNPSSLDELCRGADTVITTATAAKRGVAADIDKVDIEGNQNLIDAAKRAGVGRFVFVSALMADPASSIPLFRAKGITEQNLRSSGVPWTIVAPHMFMESWIELMVGIPLHVGLPVWLHGEGGRLHSFVSINDVAALTVAAALSETAANRRLPIGGYPVSWREIVEESQELVDQQIDMRFLPPGSPVPHVAEPFGSALGAIAELLESKDVVIESSALYEEFGVTANPLRTFLVTMLADRRRPLRDQPAFAPQTAQAPPPAPSNRESIDPGDSIHEENPGETADHHTPGE